MSNEKELHFSDLFRILLKKWYVIVASLLLCTSASWVIANFLCPKLYMARAVIYLYKPPQLNPAPYETDSYRLAYLLKMATNRAYKNLFAETVSEKIAEAGYTPIKESDIFISLGANEYDYYVEVSADSPEKSAYAANEVLSFLTWGVWRDNTVHIIYPKQLAVPPTDSYRPQYTMYLGFGAATGIALAILIIFCRRGDFVIRNESQKN